jgi:hypothetical protein
MARKVGILASQNVPRKNRPTPGLIEISAKPGKNRIRLKVKMPPQSHVEVDIETETMWGNPLEHQVTVLSNPVPEKEMLITGQPKSTDSLRKKTTIFHSFFDRLSASWKTVFTRKHWGFEKIFFTCAIILYMLTRVIQLDKFPIYFFTDEAVQTVLASDLIRDHGENYANEFLPTYFENGNQYNLSVSVYLQVIPYLLFDKSIWVTRGIAVLITLLAAVTVGLALKNIFKSRYYWVATLVLSITPAWFLHSRTAFETALAVTFYAGFIYYYLLYRQVSPRYFYWTVLMAALCFYSYSPAQMVVFVTTVFLLFSDLRYHWQNRQLVFKGLGLGILLAIPYFRFLLLHGGENYTHLVILRSYWVAELSIGQKLLQFGANWLKGLNPAYWFLPNSVDFSRHIMKEYGHLWRPTFPLLFLGIIVACRYIKSSPYRVLLIALVAAPSGAALVELGVTRALFMVIPAALLTTLGVSTLLTWLESKKIQHWILSACIFIVLAGTNIYMLSDALVNGPTWFSDYGLAGMQYGASQLFGEIRTYVKEHPDIKLIVSPSWANGADVVARFFFSDPAPFTMGSIEGYFNEKKEITSNTVFVLIPEEFDLVKNSPKFTNLKILQTIPYPDGRPGFYFVSLQYVDRIDAILSAEQAMRYTLYTGAAKLPDGQVVQVSYSRLDMGDLYNLFDGDMNTITRSEAANPLRVQVIFNAYRLVNGISVKVGGVPTRITAYVYTDEHEEPEVYTMEKPETPDPRNVDINFGKTVRATRIDIEILSIRDTEPAHVHVWEIMFK